MPLLASAYNDQKEDKKQIVAVNLKEIWQTIDKFRKNTGIPFSVALDSGELADKLKINVIPSLVLFVIGKGKFSVTLRVSAPGFPRI